jgi:hypothetical protein
LVFKAPPCGRGSLLKKCKNSLIKEIGLNRRELIKKMNEISSEVLREKGYISFIGILIRIGKLTKDDYEAWRVRRVPYLERAVTLNL